MFDPPTLLSLPNMETAAIQTHGLTRRFGALTAVEDVTFTVATGQFFGFLGPNGAGKSTTIKMLMNLIEPTAGEARVLGVASRQLGPRERQQIGYVSENQQLPLWMTVRQYLDYCRPFYPAWDRELETTLLAKFDLPGDRKLKHLSRGMLMKAALLSSLAYRPKLLILDEPFSGLDPLVRDEFVRGMLEVSELGGWTVLVSSHDIEEVERLCDWIAVMDEGRLQFAESTEALLGRFRRVEITVPPGEANLASSPPDWLELERNGDLVRFVTTRYEREATARACMQRFPGAKMAASPMTLRDIFIVLARAGRTAKKGAAA
jgi:ABC-2 type transport system ATP-binding protein